MMLRCRFRNHGAVATVIEEGALVATFIMRDGGNVAFVASVHYHVASMMRGECHMAFVVKWANKSHELAWVVAGLFFPVL